jgi:hypothetical protein
MYLEQTRAMGKAKYEMAWMKCPADSLYAGESYSMIVGKPISELYFRCGGKVSKSKPTFKTAYSLKGTPPSKNWFYPACNAGYTKQQVNKPHPEMYSCFDPAELEWNKQNGIMF